jgi:peptide-methionine (S)-S-oxide reductase
MNRSNFYKKLNTLKEGTYHVIYNNKKYLLRKDNLFNNRVIKIFARELGGTDIVSANYYVTVKQGTIKTCEISDKKVIDFILKLSYI